MDKRSWPLPVVNLALLGALLVSSGRTQANEAPARKAQAHHVDIAVSALRPPRIGPVALGRTREGDIEPGLGRGLVSIGFHPNSAREYLLADGVCLYVDGEYSVRSAPSYVINRFRVASVSRTDPLYCTGAPRCKLSSRHFRYCGVKIGDSLARAIRVYGKGYESSTAFDRPCRVWKAKDDRLGTSITVTVWAPQGTVRLLDVRWGYGPRA